MSFANDALNGKSCLDAKDTTLSLLLDAAGVTETPVRNALSLLGMHVQNSCFAVVLVRLVAILTHTYLFFSTYQEACTI